MKLFERYKEIVDYWSDFVEICRQPLPNTIWCNLLKTTPDKLTRKLKENHVEFEPILWYPNAFKLSNTSGIGKSLEYLAGLYHVQEEAALLPVFLLEPKPGETVLDLCAAPGNKTAQVAVQMKNSGSVIANEVNVGRMQPLRATINRLGLTNVIATHSDANRFPKQSVQFDKVIADVHCSCEGTTRKNPDILEIEENIYSKKISNSQTAILIKALQMCKVGGRVVYSTCTYAPEENETVVQTALDTVSPKIQAEIKACHVPGLKWSPGLFGWNGEQFRADMKNAIRVYPHQNDTGGFFVAVLDKLTDDRRNKVANRPNSFDYSRVKMLDKTEILSFTEERFGIPISTFENYLLFHANRRIAAIINQEHLQMSSPAPYMLGLPLVHINMKYAKLTTAGAMAFGHLAKKNILQVNDQQTGRYLRGEIFSVELGEIINYDHPGLVILKNKDIVVGVGTVAENNCRAEVHGQFPKAWQKNAF